MKITLPNKYSRRWAYIVGISITILYLIFNLFLLTDYGVSWDFSYHLNAGFYHLGKQITDPIFEMGPSAPFPDIIPTLSYLFFYKTIHLLPFDGAYNLYSVIIGSVGIGILYCLALNLFGMRVAFLSTLTLALLPRYFGHLHINMKDIPQAVFFTLSVWAFWRLIRKQNFWNLVIASVAFGLAYNSKINALFILVIAGMYLIIQAIKNRVFKLKYKRVFFLYPVLFFFLAAAAAFGLWSLFWKEPVAQLVRAFSTYSTSTTNMPVLYFGTIYLSGINIPWHFPYGMLWITTPVVTLIGFLAGLVLLVRKKLYRQDTYILILLWFFVPLLRYFKPNTVVVDDVRHFMEVLFPGAIICGIGLTYVYELMNQFLSRFKRLAHRKSILFAVFSMVYAGYLLFQTMQYHPFQTIYYNELLGGPKNARNAFDVEFWASSYKYALRFLNANAPQNSKVIVAMAPTVAKQYLRPDLTRGLNLKDTALEGTEIYEKSDYTVILNRQSLFNGFWIHPYIRDRKPAYIFSIKDVPLVYIFKNE